MQVSQAKKQLHLVCGYDGSGKTTFGKYLSRQTGYPHVECDAALFDAYSAFARGNFDGISVYRKLGSAHRRRLQQEFQNPSTKEHAYFELAHMERMHRISDALNSDGVILDGSFFNRDMRTLMIQPIQEIAAQIGSGLDTFAYWMDTDLKTCFERVKARDTSKRGLFAVIAKQLTYEMFAEQARNCQPPTPEEGFRGIYMVRNISPGILDISQLGGM